MTAEAVDPAVDPAVDRTADSTRTTWTVDELAALVGSTVRTIRYYSTLGILPPPERRGRMFERAGIRGPMMVGVASTRQRTGPSHQPLMVCLCPISPSKLASVLGIDQFVRPPTRLASESTAMLEYPIARAYLDSRISTIYGGTTEVQKEIIGRSLGL